MVAIFTTTTAVINLAAVIEKADENILPAVYYFIGRSLNASLSDLGTLTLCRAAAQAAASPLSGVLGDRFDRTHIVAAGCALWGVMTAAVGLSRSLGQAKAACGFNGLGLALVIPCISSLLADYHPAEGRGRAFGAMGLISAFGGMGGAFFATNAGGLRPFGVDGWRVSLHLMAAVSLLTAALVLRCAVDPRYAVVHSVQSVGKAGNAAAGSGAVHSSLTGSSGRGLAQQQQHQAQQAQQRQQEMAMGRATSSQLGSGAWQDVLSVLSIRSFQVLVLQGIVGSIPWQAMVMFTLWLQLLGFSNLQAASLMAVFTSGGALGGLLGGALGDRAARRAPLHGRIAVAQLSVALSLPLSALLLKGLPAPSEGNSTAPGHSAALLYAGALLAMGLCISWCGCNNSAMFAELVPERLRSQIYAFDRSFEGAVAACGAPLVGLIAERWFGFRGSVGSAAAAPDKLANAAALSNALLLCLLVPWTLCLTSYNLLHWTYPGDKLRTARGVRRSGSELELGGGGGFHGCGRGAEVAAAAAFGAPAPGRKRVWG